MGRHLGTALGLACALATLSGCKVDRPNFLGDGPDAGPTGGENGPVRGGVLISSGGGTVRSDSHKVRVIVGAPQPGGTAMSSEHTADFSARKLIQR